MTTLNRYLLLLFAAALAALLSGGGVPQAVKSPAGAAAQQVPG
jgi:hypothetical protein